MENVNVIIDGIQKNVNGLFYIYDSKYYFIYTEKELDENNYVILYMTQVGKETKNTENGPVETGYMVGVEVTDPNEQKKAQTSISYIVEDKKNNTTNSQIQYLPMSMLSNLKIVSKKRFRLLKSIMEENFKLTFESPQINAVIPEPMATQNDMSLVHPLAEIAPAVPVEPLAEPVAIQAVEPMVQPLAEIVSTVPVEPLAEPVAMQAVEPVVQPLAEIAPAVPVESLAEPVAMQAVEPMEQPLAEIAPAVPTESVVNPDFGMPLQPENNVSDINSAADENVIVDYRTKYFEEEEKNQELQVKIDELTKKLDEIKKIVEL